MVGPHHTPILAANSKWLTRLGNAGSGARNIEIKYRHFWHENQGDPDMSGISATQSIIAMRPDARIIILTTSEGDVEIQRALGAGALGYLLKGTPAEELMDAIRRVHRGHSYIPQNVAQQLAQNIGNDILSPREIQVLLQVANGGKNRDIGRQLSITEETVKAHLSSILEKLGAKDRTQAVAIGVRRGIIQI